MTVRRQSLCLLPLQRHCSPFVCCAQFVVQFVKCYFLYQSMFLQNDSKQSHVRNSCPPRGCYKCNKHHRRYSVLLTLLTVVEEEPRDIGARLLPSPRWRKKFVKHTPHMTCEVQVGRQSESRRDQERQKGREGEKEEGKSGGEKQKET